MQYFGYSVNIIFVIVALLLFQRIFLFHVQFVNGMNTSYVQIRNELASEQLIKVQFQVAEWTLQYVCIILFQENISLCCKWFCLRLVKTLTGELIIIIIIIIIVTRSDFEKHFTIKNCDKNFLKIISRLKKNC